MASKTAAGVTIRKTCNTIDERNRKKKSAINNDRKGNTNQQGNIKDNDTYIYIRVRK